MIKIIKNQKIVKITEILRGYLQYLLHAFIKRMWAGPNQLAVIQQGGCHYKKLFSLSVCHRCVYVFESSPLKSWKAQGPGAM